MLIKSYERQNHGHNPRINFAGVGHCQNCGRYATLYPMMLTSLTTMGTCPWFCGSCKARNHNVHASAAAAYAPLTHSRGQTTTTARRGPRYKVVG